MMLGAVRRYGVVHALRASVPRTICRPSNSQLLRCQTSPVTACPQSVRLLHKSSPFFSSASAQAQAQPDDLQSAAPQEPLREFTDLAERGLVDPKIIRAIVKDMNIKTMTDVQSQTLREILQGDDVLVDALALKALGPKLIVHLFLQFGSGKDRYWKNPCVSHAGIPKYYEGPVLEGAELEEVTGELLRHPRYYHLPYS